MEAIWRRLARHVDGAYANFLLSATEEDVAAIYPRQTYKRLAVVMRRYDGNLFAGNHNVRPAVPEDARLAQPGRSAVSVRISPAVSASSRR